jgi:ATP/maltotriose-dependent transcriptional regulator MalT
VPVRHILRTLSRAVPADVFAAAIAPVEHTLAGLLPDGPPTVDDQGSLRVYEALDMVWDALSQERPLVLVFEDLHWADSSTLAFLGALLTYRSSGHRMLVLTYRTEDVGRWHPLRAFLADVDRGRLAARLEPSRLDRAPIARLAADVLGRTLSDVELDRLVERSDGIARCSRSSPKGSPTARSVSGST